MVHNRDLKYKMEYLFVTFLNIITLLSSSMFSSLMLNVPMRTINPIVPMGTLNVNVENIEEESNVIIIITHIPRY